MTVGGIEMSQQDHKYFLQHSTFAYEKPQVRTWGVKFASCPGCHLTLLRPWVSDKPYDEWFGNRGDKVCLQEGRYKEVVYGKK